MIIRCVGLKASDCEIEIGKLTLCSGPNRVGKTTVADALIFCLLGYLPRLGKAEALTAQLMRDAKMTATVTLDDGKTFERSLDLTAENKYRGAVSCSWIANPKADADEINAEILKLVGGEREDAVEACDIRELLKLTGNQRTARLQALLESQTDPIRLAQLAARYTMQRLAGIAEDKMPDDYLALRPLIPGFDKGGDHAGVYFALRAAMADLKSRLEEKGLQPAIAWANEEKNAATRAMRPAVQAREKLAVRLAELGDEKPDELPQLEARRAELERATGAEDQRRQDITRKRQAVADAARKLSAAQTQHAAVVSAREEFEAHGPEELASKRETLQRLEREAAVVTLPDPPDETEPARMEEQATELERQANELKVPTIPSAADAERRVEKVEEQLQAAKASPFARLGEIATGVKAIVNAGSKGRTKLRDDVVALMDEQLTIVHANSGGWSITDIEGWLTDAREELQTLRTEIEAAERTAAGIRDQQRDLRSEAGALRTRATQLRTELRREYQAARSTVEEDARTSRDAVQRLRNAITALDQRDQRTAEALRTAETELHAAQQRCDDLGTAPAEEAASEHSAELNRVKAQIKSLQEDAAVRREHQRMVDEIDAQRARETVFKALERALIRVREEEVTTAGGPLIAHMHTFLMGAGMTEAPYIAGGGLGWRTERGESVSVNVMSGAEFCLFTSALASAVMALRGAPERILITEAAEMDDAMLRALCAGIAAVKESLTHALVLTHRPIRELPGWSVIDLGQRREAQAA